MTKQRLEGDFASILKETKTLFSRIYHVMGSYTVVPGDFWVFGKKVYLVECKECRNKRWTFSRLSQKSELVKFNKHPLIESVIVLCFWKGRKTNSDYYIIPIERYLNTIDELLIKSLNDKDFFQLFFNHKVDYKDLNLYFQ